jgi:hypothetical protein
MTLFFKIFWLVLIFASIAWYGFLVFVVGIKGGKDILDMIKELTDQNDAQADV